CGSAWRFKRQEGKRAAIEATRHASGVRQPILGIDELSMAVKVDILSGIVCDEVRREDNGKLILKSGYSSHIVVAELPALLVPWPVVKVRAENPPIEEPFDVKVMLGNKQLRTAKGRMRLADASPTWVALPNLLLEKIEHEGRLEFLIRVGGSGKW